MELNRQLNSFQLRKAYLISLCLSAQRVLAEDTGSEEKAAERALLDQVLDALKQPSGEHMQIYVCLGLALAIIAGIVYMSFGEKQIKVTLDDVDDGAPKKRAKAKRHPDAAPSAQTAAVVE